MAALRVPSRDLMERWLTCARIGLTGGHCLQGQARAQGTGLPLQCTQPRTAAVSLFPDEETGQGRSRIAWPKRQSGSTGLDCTCRLSRHSEGMQ